MASATESGAGACAPDKPPHDAMLLLWVAAVHLNTLERVRVFWAGDHRYYHGTVVCRGVFVRYDDGDEQWESVYELE